MGKTDNKLPWRLPADLKRFKSITLGKPVIMGRKTFESIGRPLSGRTNIIITGNEKYLAPGCIVVHSPEEAIRASGQTPEIMVIGGAKIFTWFLVLAKRMYLTLIDDEFMGNIYFPEWNPEEWQEVERETHKADEKNPFGFTFLVLDRVKNPT